MTFRKIALIGLAVAGCLSMAPMGAEAKTAKHHMYHKHLHCTMHKSGKHYRCYPVKHSHKAHMAHKHNKK